MPTELPESMLSYQCGAMPIHTCIASYIRHFSTLRVQAVLYIVALSLLSPSRYQRMHISSNSKSLNRGH